MTLQFVEIIAGVFGLCGCLSLVNVGLVEVE
jgi:hypothetical protein